MSFHSVTWTTRSLQLKLEGVGTDWRWHKSPYSMSDCLSAFFKQWNFPFWPAFSMKLMTTLPLWTVSASPGYHLLPYTATTHSPTLISAGGYINSLDATAKFVESAELVDAPSSAVPDLVIDIVLSALLVLLIRWNCWPGFSEIVLWCTMPVDCADAMHIMYTWQTLYIMPTDVQCFFISHDLFWWYKQNCNLIQQAAGTESIFSSCITKYFILDVTFTNIYIFEFGEYLSLCDVTDWQCKCTLWICSQVKEILFHAMFIIVIKVSIAAMVKHLSTYW